MTYLLLSFLHTVRHAIFETSTFLFKKRRQRVKINNTYSSWSEIIFVVPQGSILDPLLFNIFLCDLFFFVPDIGIANYADDNIPHATSKHLETVLKDLDQRSDTLLKWFTENLFKVNPEKYQRQI